MYDTISPIMNNISKSTIGKLSILGAALLWSLGGLLIKSIDAPATFIAMGRSLIAGLFFLPALKFKKIKMSKKLIALSICYSACLTTFVVSNKLTAAANAITLQYSAPLFLFIGTWIFSKKFLKQKLIPMIIILFGIIAFLLEPVTGSNIYGNILAVVSGLCFAGVIYLLGFDYGISGPGLTSLLNLMVVPVVAIIVPWNTSPWPKDSISIVMLLVLGVVQIGLSYILFTHGRKTVSSLDSSILSLVEPLLNPVWVFLFIGEEPTIFAIVGMILIISAQITNAFMENRRVNRQALNNPISD